MTNSFVLTPTKLVSVELDDKNAKGVIAFRDNKGEVTLLDFTAYGKTGEKLLGAKLGSKFDAEGSINVIKTADKGNVTSFEISRVSALKDADGDLPVDTEPAATIPVQAIAPKATVPVIPYEDLADENIPF